MLKPSASKQNINLFFFIVIPQRGDVNASSNPVNINLNSTELFNSMNVSEVELNNSEDIQRMK